MRSRFIRTLYRKNSVDFSLRAQAEAYASLAPSALQDGAGSIADMQFRGALLTQPDNNPRSVDPEEWAHLLGYLHRLIALQPLQRLDEKHSIVEISVG